MVETDAPYMAPTPFRGKRCDSRYVYRMAETIADIKGLTRQEVEEATTATGRKLFGIPDGGGRSPTYKGDGFMKGDIITYDYYGGLYINMTNRATATASSASGTRMPPPWGGLWLQEEPTKEAVLEEILAQDLTPYAEIVFCGYGEPTCRADDLFWICDQLHAAGRADLPPIRLNTNGHGGLINHRDITPELAGRLDAVSVSLNGSDQEEYLRLTRPRRRGRRAGRPCWTSSGGRPGMCPR